MLRVYVLLLLIIFTSCSKKEVKYTILEEYKTTTYLLLKKRVSKQEVIDIAEEFISKKENKEKISICFFLTKKQEAPFSIVYFSNSKIHEVKYPFHQKKFDAFFNLKINENILNHWELKYSSTPRQVFIFEKDEQLFYKSLQVDFYSDKLYNEYSELIVNIDTLENNEVKFQLKNNDTLKYYIIDKNKNLKTFYKNSFTDIIHHKMK